MRWGIFDIRGEGPLPLGSTVQNMRRHWGSTFRKIGYCFHISIWTMDLPQQIVVPGQ